MGLFQRLLGGKVTISSTPIPDPVVAHDVGPIVDQGEEHHRLWVQFLSGAIEDIQTRLAVLTLTSEERLELETQLEDKQAQRTAHERIHPNAANDELHMANYLKTVRGE